MVQVGIIIIKQKRIKRDESFIQMDKKPYWTFNGSVIKCHLVNEDKANKYNI